jgi:hypothetical protein
MDAAGVAVPEYILHQNLRFADIFFVPAAAKLQSVKLGP